MPNLVGIGNSQVPTNAMLGGLAYQDSVGEINLDKIKARTSDTAKDIFVYDTRKDSDGGAWRKRTTHTSWYNEGASATRGARKEFPAVAVIVVEANQVTIYDGDDPNLPMWMVFNQSTIGLGAMVGYTTFSIGSCTMLNGVLMVGMDASNQANVAGLRIINFISERFDWKANIAGRNSNQPWPIIDRNGGRPFGFNDGQLIVNEVIKDVAATVLKNTPIDESTGLPNPTIAIATAGGTNVIRHDRTVVQGYQTIATEHVDLHPDGYMIDGISGATNDSFSLYEIHEGVPDSNITDRFVAYGHRANVQDINTFLNEGTGECLFEESSNKIAIAQSQGLLRIVEELDVDRVNDADSSGLHNRTTSSYNTGWMVGDIKGAFLSDTDDTNITGEKVDLTTGSSPGAGNWSSISANSIVAGTTGDAIGRYDTGTDGSVLVVGKQYLATLTISNYSGSGDLGLSGGAGFDSSFRYSANGTYHTYITYDSGEVQIFYRSSNTATIALSLKEVDIDRSVNNKGLGIHGTITKTPVAAGAELVYYGGFSNSNYFSQPYNSALNFGTGDLYIMFWAYFTQNNAYDTIMARRAHNGSAYTGNGWYVEMGNNQNIQIKDSASGSARAQIDADSTYGVWQHICFVRRSNIGYSYKNGSGNANRYTWSENLDNTSAILTIGRGTISGSGDADKTRLALVRIGAGAPSAEQVKKMYEDEKKLFYNNAKCTFHGTSDNVEALAYDDTTNVLHVGTSSGRSEFQGLNRINNTTTAVTTAISVSDEFVAEQ